MSYLLHLVATNKNLYAQAEKLAESTIWDLNACYAMAIDLCLMNDFNLLAKKLKEIGEKHEIYREDNYNLNVLMNLKIENNILDHAAFIYALFTDINFHSGAKDLVEWIEEIN